MKEIIYFSFLLVVLIAFVVGYLNGKDSEKQKSRRTPRAADVCPVCDGRKTYDTLETVEPCPACNSGKRG